MVLGRKNQLFPRKKMVLGRKTTIFFPRKKMVLGRKNQLFPEKATKKKSFRKLCGQTPKGWFFWFSLGKRWFWAEKTNFFLGKTKKTIFLESGRIVYHFWFFVFPRKKLVFLPKTLPKTMFFVGKSWFFCPKPSFS